MVSLNGLTSGTFDQLFVRDGDTITEIRDLFTSGGSAGVTAAFVSAAISPIELAQHIMNNTLVSQNTALNAATTRLTTIETQAATILNDPITLAQANLRLSPLEYTATAHSANFTTNNEILTTHTDSLQDLDSRLSTVETQAATILNDPITLAQANLRLSPLEYTATAHSANFTTNNAILATLQSDVAILTTSISGIITEADVTTLLAYRDAQITTNSQGIAAQLNTLITQGSNIANNASAITTLQSDVSSAESNITIIQSANATFATDITLLQNDLAAWGNSTTITLASFGSTINNIQGDIASNVATLTVLSTSVSSLSNSMTSLNTYAALKDPVTGELNLNNAVIADTARVGRFVPVNALFDGAMFSHVDMVGYGDYALYQSQAGTTRLNSAAGQSLTLRIDDDLAMQIYSDKRVKVYESLESPLVTAHNLRIGDDANTPSSTCAIQHTALGTQSYAYSIKVNSVGRTWINGGVPSSPQDVIIRNGGTDACLFAGSGSITMYHNTSFQGNLTVSGTKNFDIPHPGKEGLRIRHRCIESDRALNMYRLKLQCAQGLNRFALPEYFTAINDEPMVWVNPVRHRGNAWADVEGSELLVDASKAGLYIVLVTGIRSDDKAQEEYAQYGVVYEAPVVEEVVDEE